MPVLFTGVSPTPGVGLGMSQVLSKHLWNDEWGGKGNYGMIIRALYALLTRLDVSLQAVRNFISSTQFTLI